MHELYSYVSASEGQVLIERGPLILAAPRRLNQELGPDRLALAAMPGATCTVEIVDSQTVFTIAGDRADQTPLRLTALSQAGTGGADDPYVAVFPTQAG